MVCVVRKAYIAENAAAIQIFLKSWDAAQKAYKVDARNVQQYEAKRVGQSPDDFAKLIDAQTVSHPTLEQIVTVDFLGAPGKELDSRLMKHLQGIAAFLSAEKRIQAAPADWSGIFNTKPIQTYLVSRK
jgi:ABC-type taurine transport system substrate-binding protein